MKLSRTYAVGKVALLGLALTLGACSGGGSGGGGSAAPVATATISGKVTGSSSSVSTSSVHGKAGKMVADGCSSGTWVGKYVGEGGADAASGSFSSNSFEVPTVPVKKEMIITFTCNDGSTQRCLVKSGDAGVQCNAVADGVMGAFESALGVTLYDATLAGKSISKVGAAIVQAAENDSTSTSSFKAAIEDCKALTSGKEVCYKSAIEASVFAGPFKLMQTMVSGWTVDGLFTLMADVYGAQIGVDTFIYSDFATDMDTWLGTDFVANTRAYIAAVITDQLAGGSTYVTSVQCQMWYQKYQSGGKIIYTPALVNNKPTCINHAAWTTNGLPDTGGTAYTAIDNAITNQTWQQISIGSDTPAGGCNGGQVWQTSGAFCVSPPNLVITSRFVEGNRNDPLGENGGDFYDQPRVDMIRIFQEVETALQAADPACVTMGQNGPPVITQTQACKDYFGGLLASHKKGFAGLMGLYMFLKSPAGYGGGLLSLTDIYKVYGGTNFLNMKVALNGFNMCGGNISDGNGGYLPALGTYTSGIFVAQSGNTCSMSGNSYTTSQAQTRVAAAGITYESSFQAFEEIPSATEIRSFVFGSGFHSDWNPTGPKMFYAAKVKNTNYPIFCKMYNTDTQKPKESQLDAKTGISCLTDTQLNSLGINSGPDAKGVMTLPDEYPYVLQNYGYQGDTKGAVFALADAKTGMQIRPGGGPILVWQIDSDNGSACTATAGLATAKLNFGWGEKTQEQAAPVYCMDMSGFAQPSGNYNLFVGGNVSVKQTNWDGTTWDWNIQLVGMRNGTSSTALQPICYWKGTNSALTIGASKLVTNLNGTSGEVQALGADDSIDLCSATHAGTKYYLMMGGAGWMGSNRDTLKAHLIEADATSTTPKIAAGAQNLQWRDWSDAACQNGGCDWESNQVWIKSSLIESTLNGGACGAWTNCKVVSPTGTSTPIFGLQMANQRWQAKFDPYCDDLDGNGYCDCYAAGTTTLVSDPKTCSLEHDAAEPTLSQPPYYLKDQYAANYQTLFTQAGGKHTGQFATALGLGAGGFNHTYLNNQNIHMDMFNVFQCQYKATGEAYYRKPTNLDWSNFDNPAPGCPDSNGTIGANGPIRLIKPVAANNTYSISRPNTLIKMINYATKTVGQGVTVSATEKVFTFDEALALVALRGLMPMVGTPVYAPGTSSPSPSAVVPGVVPTFRQVHLGNNDNTLDISSAVLRGITHPEEL